MSNLPALQSRLSDARDRATRADSIRTDAEKKKQKSEKELEKLGKELEKLQNVVDLLRSLSGAARDVVTDTINPLAKKALQEVFGARAEFEITFRELPKTGYAARIISGNGQQLGNPLETDGQSMAEIVSDAVLRPLTICIHTPTLNRIVILDEPFAGVDSEKTKNLCEFMRSLSDRLDIQWVITSHTFDAEFDEYVDNAIVLEGS